MWDWGTRFRRHGDDEAARRQIFALPDMVVYTLIKRGCMEVREPYEVIIVGGGAAGLAAGLYCQRAALKAVLFERGLIGGQIAVSKEVENYPGVEGITGFDLADKLLNHAKGFGLRVIQEEVAVVEPGPEMHTVRLVNGDRYETRAVILAAGGSVRKLNVPGEAEYLGRGVSYCAACDGFFFREKRVVVVGGGEAAVEEALFLARIAKKVFLVHRGSEVRTGRWMRNRLGMEPNIEVIANAVITGIRGDGEAVTGVTLESRDAGVHELAADGVFIFIGYEPSTSLVPPEVRRNEEGFVITDEKCETSVPGIFAVGDLRQKFANQIIIAAADGATAALGAAHYVESKKPVLQR